MSMNPIRRPCDECPWRKDAEPGRFPAERWDSLRASSLSEEGWGPDFFAPMFACHKTPEGGERACAGWLAVEGAHHPRVRFGVGQGELTMCMLEPGEDWPELHESFIATRDHDMGAGT